MSYILKSNKQPFGCFEEIKVKFLKRLGLVLLILVLAAFGFLSSSYGASIVNAAAQRSQAQTAETPSVTGTEPSPDSADTPESVSVSTPEPTPSLQIVIRIVHPGGAEESVSVNAGESIPLSSYRSDVDMTFVGWLDSKGNIYNDESVFNYSMQLTEYCVPRFDDSRHGTYLSLKNGIFYVNGTVTRGTFASFARVYLASEQGVNYSDGFEDLRDVSNLYPAGCKLKYYKAVGGEEYRPYDALTYGEIWSMLAMFMPVPAGIDYYPIEAGDMDYALACAEYYGWIPNGQNAEELLSKSITRLEYVKLINGILGREGDSEGRSELVGVILDVPETAPDYWAIVEAVIPHTCEGCGSEEVWLESTPSDAEALPQGINLIGGKVYYIKEDGSMAVDEEINGFRYGHDGAYTSGNEELDALITETFIKSEAEKKSTPLEQLKAVFYYFVYHSTYRKGPLHEDGGREWVMDTAIEMLSTGKGNCYSFASAFWAMARALGYDATVYTGTLDSTDSPHGWVEIILDGERYLCDPEITYQDFAYKKQYTDMFMQNNPYLFGNWGYHRYEGQE